MVREAANEIEALKAGFKEEEKAIKEQIEAIKSTNP